jgi:hypothetical protein
MVKRYRIVRQYATRSGLRTEDVSLPAMGVNALTLTGVSVERVLENARSLGLYGVTALECDQDGRLVGERVSA